MYLHLLFMCKIAWKLIFWESVQNLQHAFSRNLDGGKGEQLAVLLRQTTYWFGELRTKSVGPHMAREY